MTKKLNFFEESLSDEDYCDNESILSEEESEDNLNDKVGKLLSDKRIKKGKFKGIPRDWYEVGKVLSE